MVGQHASDISHKSPWTAVLRAAWGVAAVFFLTFVAFFLRINLASVGFLYLLLVVVLAITLGFGPATASSLVAVTCLNYYFVPPVLSWRVDDPANWVALFVFEATVLIVSRLSTRAQRAVQDARQQSTDRQRLYDLSRGILLMERVRPAGEQLMMLICDLLPVESAGLFDAQEAKSHGFGPDHNGMEAAAKSTYFQDRGTDDSDQGIWQRVLRLDSRSIGGIALRSQELNGKVIDAVSSLAVIAIDRSRSQERAARAEAARDSEQLRTAVLDALAHAFKTPLTVIRAASSGLLEAGGLRGADEELVKLIESETANLSQLSTNLLKTARLDPAAAKSLEICNLRDIVDQVLSDLSSAIGGRPVSVDLPELSARLQCNRELLVMGLTQLIDNAAKYSTPGSTITVRAQTDENGTVIKVHNLGPVISPEDRERIFERFYRGRGAHHLAAGTGIGLSVTKRAAEAHGGRAWVESNNHHGTTFYVSIPSNASGLARATGMNL
jgi:two-component system sensor histidine kinase KdpD